MRNSILAFLLLSGFVSCNSPKVASEYDFPSPVDTNTRPIVEQLKTTYNIEGVYVSNQFRSARLNGFEKANDTLYRATITPENTPVNHSPWYAFKLWADRDTSILVELNYTEHFHRYPPKISKDKKKWALVDSTNIFKARDSVDIVFRVDISKDTTWVAAQEIQDSKDVENWVDNITLNPFVNKLIVGNSTKGRPLLLADIYNGRKGDKPLIIIFSRQHPPEVTGYLAMMAFVEKILDADKDFLDNFRIMVFPLLNPDGVDLGHFRHNYGGIDLNRDWAYYRQPEIRQIADFIVKESAESKNEVILGLDFHSTWSDVYYTFDESIDSKLDWFTDRWLAQIQDSIQSQNPEYRLNEQPSGLGSPVSKGWFYTQFNAESITYEIGDRTPRDFIKYKGEISAMIMIDLLLREYDIN